MRLTGNIKSAIAGIRKNVYIRFRYDFCETHFADGYNLKGSIAVTGIGGDKLYKINSVGLVGGCWVWNRAGIAVAEIPLVGGRKIIGVSEVSIVSDYGGCK